jgi:hypothetical protein
VACSSGKRSSELGSGDELAIGGPDLVPCIGRDVVSARAAPWSSSQRAGPVGKLRAGAAAEDSQESIIRRALIDQCGLASTASAMQRSQWARNDG